MNVIYIVMPMLAFFLLLTYQLQVIEDKLDEILDIESEEMDDDNNSNPKEEEVM